MKYIKLSTMLISLLFGGNLFAQATLSDFELRMENGQLMSSTTYQFDVYLYNHNATSFELRAGTVSFWINPNWRNSGTITGSISSSNLVAAQQSGTSAYTSGTPDFFRRTIANVSAGAGTNVGSHARVKLFTILFTNTASFSASATPNFAWKFSGTNSCGFTYTDTTTTASAIAVNATTVTGTQIDCFTPTYWNGSQWNAGSTSAGSVSTASPTTTKDAIIFTGTFSGAISCRNYSLNSGATHNLGASTLEVTYNLNNSGTFSGTNGTINLVGTDALQTSNQAVSGNNISIANLGFGVSANSGNKTLNANVSVADVVIQAGTATLSSGGKLTLLSSATGTARIAELTSGSAISGAIVVERFIPASYRRYRFLASPVVGGTTLQWRDNGQTNSGRGIQITHPSGPADASFTNSASAFKYTESLSTGGSDIQTKWESVDGNTSLTNGQGYRVFVRGDRSKSLVDNSDTVPNNTTIWVSGTYPTSPVTLPVTYNPSLGNGWNLVGNPFPSPIDWNASSGWTKTNIGNAIYIWNPVSSTFGSFDGTTGTNSVTRYIASGQSFFVQANGSSPVLTASESVKIGNTPSNLFKGAETNCLRVYLSQGTTEKDEMVVRFMENKNDAFTTGEDVVKLQNPNLNIGSFGNTNTALVINYLNQNSLSDKVVPLQAKVKFPGTYLLTFAQVNDFNADIQIYLKDHYKGTSTDIRKNNSYAFEVDALPHAIADGRLELVFSNKTNGLNQDLATSKMQWLAYPNPVKDLLNLQCLGNQPGLCTITIYTLTGAKVYESEDSGGQRQIDVSTLSAGCYWLRIENEAKELLYTGKFVK